MVTEPIEDEDEESPEELSSSSQEGQEGKITRTPSQDEKNFMDRKALPLLIVALVLACLLLVACILRVCCCKAKNRDDEKKGKTSGSRQSELPLRMRSLRDLTEEEKAVRNFVARIVIIGDSGTGKTALLKAYTDTYPASVPPALASGARMAVEHGNKILDQSGKLGYAEGSLKLS